MREVLAKPLECLGELSPQNREAINAQASKIAQSKGFSEADQLKNLLSYLVRMWLNGEADKVTETCIALDALKKRQDFDPQVDSSVRVLAGRLRKSLAAYYATAGKDDRILIDMPNGYILLFTVRADASGSAATIRWFRRVGAGIAAALIALALFLLFTRTGSRVTSVSPLGLSTGRLFATATSEGRTPIRLDLNHVFGHLIMARDGKKLYAIELRGRAVSVLGVEDLQVRRTLQLPTRARTAVMSHDGKRIYVASMDGGVMLIDTKEDRVLEQTIPTQAPVFDIAVTPDEKKMFLALSDAGLTRISLPNLESTVISKLPCPVFLDLDPLGRQLFVSYQCGGPGGREGHDAFEIYDTNSEQSVGGISGNDLPMVGGTTRVAPQGGLVLIDGLDACESSQYDHTGCRIVPSRVFYLFRIADHRVISTLFRPVVSRGATFSPDGNRLVFSGDTLEVVDWAKQTVLERLPNQGEPFAKIAFTPTGRRSFVSFSLDPGLLVFDADDSEYPSPSGLAHLYSGDGTLDDSQGVSSLTAKGPVQFARGLIGQAFQLNGKDTFLVASSASACPFCTDSWTESLFVKFGSLDGQMTILERTSYTGHWRHRLYKAHDQRIVLESGNRLAPSQSIFSSRQVRAAAWYHVAVVTSKGHASLYLDGMLQGQVDLMADAENQREFVFGPVFFGASEGKSNFLEGMLDEVAFYHRALGTAEIKTISEYRNRRPGGPSAPLAAKTISSGLN